ncbi:hypothetical protein PG984_007774 [Apiospora sp. TS-2023a]
MASAVQPQDHFSGLATELKLEIFCQLPDALSVRNLALASKAFHSILHTHYATIVRALVNHLVSPECAKLAVMAIESRSVDPLDDDSMQGFFDQFMNRDELRDDQYGLEVASKIPSLHHAIVALQNQNPIRLIQTYYVVEIFSNLCHGLTAPINDRRVCGFGMIVPDVDSSDIMPDSWATKFWGRFSEEEISLAASFGPVLYHHQEEVKNMLSKFATYEDLQEEGIDPVDPCVDVTTMPEGTSCTICDGPDGIRYERVFYSFEKLYHFSNFFTEPRGQNTLHFRLEADILPWVDDLADWIYVQLMDPNPRGPVVRRGIFATSPFLSGLGK